MSIDTMNSKIAELRELRRMADELAEEIKSLQDEIKAEMTAHAVDTLTGTDWKASWKVVKSSRLDGKSLKDALPDIAAQFMKETTSRRFLLS